MGTLRRWGFGSALLPTLLLVGAMGLSGGIGFALRGPQGVVVERSSSEAGEAGTSHDTGSDELEGTVESAQEEEAKATYVVHVDGAVAAPGVVRIEGDDVRVFDAVDAAGGLLDDADTSSVNLAESLMDGAKIHIPHEGEVTEADEPATTAGQVTTVGATGVEGGRTLVNINTATSEELQTLRGVGEATARLIIEDRERNGPFASIEDLMRISGIGEKKFEKVRESICV